MRTIRTDSRFLVLLAAALATLLLASVGSAQPIPQPPTRGTVQLRWNNCFGDGGTSNRAFACNTNSGVEELIVSATPWEPLPQFNGVEASIRVISTLPSSTPSWWQFGGTSCRLSTHLSMVLSPPSTSTTCVDPWQGGGFGGINYQTAYFGDPSLNLLRLVAAVSPSVSLNANEEVFLFNVRVSHGKTVGAGSCAGCSVPMGLLLYSLNLTQPAGVGDMTLMAPIEGTGSDVVTWQDIAMHSTFVWIGSVHQLWDKTTTFISPTPAQRPTWGSVKSLYR